MGIYDIYGETQLKIGDVRMSNYKVGDEDIQLGDGIYIGYEGFVVIKNHQFIVDFPFAVSKWGDIVYPKEIIEQLNPVSQAIKNMEKEDAV